MNTQSSNDTAALTAPCVIVAGAPRSGTSMTAEVLVAAGLYMGDHLVPANVANRHGYFEDVGAVRLHERIMGQSGLPWRDMTEVRFPVTEQHRDEMREIAGRLSEAGHPWGFKDPRVCFFLEDWREAIGDFNVVMVYRHYLPVARSYYRRHSRVLCYGRTVNKREHIGPFADPLFPFRLWLSHNRGLLEFYRRHPERCIVVSQDAVLGGWDLVAAARSHFGVPFDLDAGSTVEPELAENSALTFPSIDENTALGEELEATWQELTAISRTPGFAPLSIERPRPRPELQEQVRIEVAQIQRLREVVREREAAENAQRVPFDRDTAELHYCHEAALLIDHPQKRLDRLRPLLEYYQNDVLTAVPLGADQPKRDAYWHHRASLGLMRSGAYDAALVECLTALRLDPESVPAVRVLRRLLRMQDIRDADVEVWRRPLVYDAPADVLMKLSFRNAALGNRFRDKYFYFAGAAVCMDEAGAERLLDLAEETGSEDGGDVLLHCFVEHLATLRTWLASNPAGVRPAPSLATLLSSA